MVMSPPYTDIAPAAVMLLLMVIAAVLVVLPIVTLLSVEPKAQPDMAKELVKLSATDSIRKAPVPAKVLLVGLGALFCSTSVPALMVVVPL